MSARKQPPRRARTPEGREDQLISLAQDLAERQLIDGTASAQVINTLLRSGQRRERLEQEKLMRENLLLAAKTDDIAARQDLKALFEDAIGVMRTYSGQGSPEDYERDDFDDV